MGSLLRFFSLTFAVTWICFITAVATSHGTASTVPALAVVRGLLLLLGTFAPSFVALGITARDNGTAGTQTLLRHVFEWRVKVRWYLFAIGYMAVIKLTVALSHRAIIGSWPRLGNEAWYVIVVAILFSTPVQAGEEIGWRGYALPRLAAHFGFARASVLLGLIWACWHLPLFFLALPGNDEYGQSFPVWALGVTALSVAIAWLYANTKGSLLLTMLMHSAVNNIPHFVPSAVTNARNVFSLHTSLVAWLTAVFLWVTALYFIARMPRAEQLHCGATTSDLRNDAPSPKSW